LIVKSRAHTALLAASSLWCLTIVVAPLAGAPAIYALFSVICHQDPARSWHVLGEPLPVCIRCASIYFGFLASLWLGIRASAQWLRIAIVFMAAEFVLARLIIDASAIRSLSGILLGVAAAPFVRQGIEEIRESMQTVWR
jgi:uncharacterized membrane protein